MKQIFTLLIILTAAFPALALNSRLTISAANADDNISVQVDGRNYQFNRSRNNKDIVIDDLRAGYHSIKVYKQSYSRRNNGRQSNNIKLIYSGNVYVRNGFHTDITINRFGKAFTDERQIGRYDDEYDNDYGYEDNDRDWNRQGINERSFEQLKQTIRRENYDDGKIAITKSAIRNQLISSTQVRELLGLFSFEASKLDIAKYCYHYASDPETYYLVANSFGFSNSKQELLRYIETNRRR